MKKLILTLIMMFGIAGMSYAFVDSYTIDRSQLPDEAREMLDTYFPKAKIASIKIDRHLLKKQDYKVKLLNGTSIEFSNSGKWRLVTCDKKAVPDDLIPAPIRRTLRKQYPDMEVISVRKNTVSYQVTLSDGSDLTLNLLGKIL